MRNKRVVIYGGTDLTPPVTDYITSLSYELLEQIPCVLATGGFKKYFNSTANVQSTDVSVLNGARKFASIKDIPLESVLETWVPEPTKDQRQEGLVERFDEGSFNVLHGFSDQARRLRLVQIADALITVKGVVRTALVLDMAVAVARPAVPLPFTGGDSADHWKANRSYYLSRLGISEEQAENWEHLNLETASHEQLAGATQLIVSTIARITRRNCLVLMPFREQLDEVYGDLEKVIDGLGFHPLRLDRELYVGDVRDTVRRLLRESDAVVADITEASPNVMYEIGLAHAYDREPLLLWRGQQEAAETRLPFYLKPQRVAFVPGTKALLDAVREYLTSSAQGMKNGGLTQS